MKKCSKCKEDKDSDKFYRTSQTRDGLRSYCIICYNKITKEWKEKNKEKYNKGRLSYYHRNREKVNKRTREYQAKLRECVQAYHEIYDRPETIQEFKKRWFSEKMQ